MIYINSYGISPEKDKLYLWVYPSSDKETPKKIDQRHDSITVDLESTPAVAVPKNTDAVVTIDSETPFESRMVPWKRYLWVYKNLAQYSLVKHLVDNHDFAPLHVDQNSVSTNQIYEVYKQDPIAQPIDGLEIRQGLKLRTRLWNLPEHGPFVGVNFAYTTTNYFTEPLDQLFNGVTNDDYWLKMNCPSDCPHGECTFHGRAGLIGRFDGFSDDGEACRYHDHSDTKYVALSPSANGVTTNPPVERVVIEPSYPNIRQWATDKSGPDGSLRVEEIERQRLGIPRRLSDTELREQQAMYEQKRLRRLVGDIDRELKLITSQPATLAEQPIQIVP